MARENKTRYAILGALSIRPASGYQIKQFMQRSTRYFWAESDGQIYPILRQLEEEGLVYSEEQTQGARKSKVYTIAPEGLEELSYWLGEPYAPSVHRVELFLKLFFGRHAPAGSNVRHLDRYQQELLAHKKVAEEGLQHVQHEHADGPDTPYWVLAIKRGLLLIEAQLEWCVEARKVLSKLDAKRDA